MRANDVPWTSASSGCSKASPFISVVASRPTLWQKDRPFRTTITTLTLDVVGQYFSLTSSFHVDPRLHFPPQYIRLTHLPTLKMYVLTGHKSCVGEMTNIDIILWGTRLCSHCFESQPGYKCLQWKPGFKDFSLLHHWETLFGQKSYNLYFVVLTLNRETDLDPADNRLERCCLLFLEIIVFVQWVGLLWEEPSVVGTVSSIFAST